MKLSVQLYSVRDQASSDLLGTLRSLKKMGLHYVELAGTYGLPAAELKAILDDTGLGVTGAHVGLGELEGDLDKVIADHKTLGNDFIVIPWLGEADYKEGWDKFAARIAPIGKKLKAAGLQLGYHNHAFEFAKQEGKLGLDVLFESSDPDELKAQVDLFWVWFGKEDPAAYLKKLGKRVKQVHLKDGLDKPEPVFAEPGAGVVDWDSVLAACTESGVEVGSIEYDVAPRHPLESVEASVKYFRAKGIRE
ncbi:MAG: sugar phosphate isomerase/epimerase [Armatimonadetes bacterium]|nr:sugar phosphate isomerase/epimerase [Armatimonadota bacterium]